MCKRQPSSPRQGRDGRPEFQATDLRDESRPRPDSLGWLFGKSHDRRPRMRGSTPATGPFAPNEPNHGSVAPNEPNDERKSRRRTNPTRPRDSVREITRRTNPTNGETCFAPNEPNERRDRFRADRTQRQIIDRRAERTQRSCCAWPRLVMFGAMRWWRLPVDMSGGPAVAPSEPNDVPADRPNPTTGQRPARRTDPTEPPRSGRTNPRPRPREQAIHHFPLSARVAPDRQSPPKGVESGGYCGPIP
jgi:hypothetical protein